MLCFFGILSLFISCNQKRLDTAELAEEVKDRRVRKITESKILEATQKKANLILGVVEKDFNRHMAKNLATTESKAICSIQPVLSVDSLSYIYKTTIQKVSRSYTSDGSVKGKYIFSLVDAYAYNASVGLKSEDNLQKLDDNTLLFTRPILLSSETCMNCHKKGTNSSEFWKTKFPASTLFSQDKDSLLGLWAITFDKKEIIRNIK